MKRVLRSVPTGLTVDKVYSVYASLRWDRGEQFDEYVISYREEGGECSGDNKLIHVDKKSDHCVVYPLKPETLYQFRMLGKVDGMETRWSETISATTERVVSTGVDRLTRELENSLDNVDDCIRILKNVAYLSGRGGKEKTYYLC